MELSMYTQNGPGNSGIEDGRLNVFKDRQDRQN